jgi:hypothetical protein
MLKKHLLYLLGALFSPRFQMQLRIGWKKIIRSVDPEED